MEHANSWTMWIMLVLLVGFAVLVVRTIRDGIPNTPTWKGIIISLLLGLLIPYLVCCFFGWMGEERNQGHNLYE